jgi:hypothetical protein
MPSEPWKRAKPKTEEPRLSRGRTREGAIFPVAPSAAFLPGTYAATLQEIKSHLRGARVRAILAANPIVIEAYWNTGRIILARQEEAGWGAKVIDRLAAALQAEFPDMGGLTSRNLLSMKIFAREFPAGPIAKQPVSQLPWGQIIRFFAADKATLLHSNPHPRHTARHSSVKSAERVVFRNGDLQSVFTLIPSTHEFTSR